MNKRLTLAFYLFVKFALLAAVVALSGCNPLRHLFKPSPQRQLATLIAEHPELERARDTVRVPVLVRVPETRIVAAPLPVAQAVIQADVIDRAKVDSLMNRLESRLDSAQREAVRGQIIRTVFARPTADTVRFDSLGVALKLWWQLTPDGAHLRPIVTLTRGELTARDTVALPVAPVVVHPEDARGAPWPWWVWLLTGAVVGCVGTVFIKRA